MTVFLFRVFFLLLGLVSERFETKRNQPQRPGSLNGPETWAGVRVRTEIRGSCSFRFESIDHEIWPQSLRRNEQIAKIRAIRRCPDHRFEKKDSFFVLFEHDLKIRAFPPLNRIPQGFHGKGRASLAPGVVRSGTLEEDLDAFRSEQVFCRGSSAHFSTGGSQLAWSKDEDFRHQKMHQKRWPPGLFSLLACCCCF